MNEGPVKSPDYVALSGGVGGAKLCLGLSRIISGPELAVIVNCGDDFEHLGLHVSPDIDTVMYTLAGMANRQNGWGREDETWSFMEAMEKLGGSSWFRLGDKDLATNIERTRRLRLGHPLSLITTDLCAALGVKARILPATDGLLRTLLETDAGLLEFQDYLVKRRAEPVIRAVVFNHDDRTVPAPGVTEALASPALQGVIVCPSNPFVSIDPILAVPGIADAIRSCQAPVIAVSPIVGGKAIKGPAAKMFRELGHEPSALSVAEHYGDLIDGMVIDVADERLASEIGKLGITTAVTDTIMNDDERKAALASVSLELADKCRIRTHRSAVTEARMSKCG